MAGGSKDFAEMANSVESELKDRISAVGNLTKAASKLVDPNKHADSTLINQEVVVDLISMLLSISDSDPDDDGIVSRNNIIFKNSGVKMSQCKSIELYMALEELKFNSLKFKVHSDGTYYPIHTYKSDYLIYEDKQLQLEIHYKAEGLIAEAIFVSFVENNPPTEA